MIDLPLQNHLKKLAAPLTLSVHQPELAGKGSVSILVLKTSPVVSWQHALCRITAPPVLVRPD